MLSWETGIEFGRALEALRQHAVQIMGHEDRLAAVESDQRALHGEIKTLRDWVIRGGLLALLWSAAIAGNLTAEQVGEIAGTTLKNLVKK